MGLYKYASYKMELDVYRRKKGIDPITKEQIPLSKPKNQQKDVDQEVSSGLTKQN